MVITPEYTERVYAGVLGKIIGVYLGRPFEGWTYEKIMRELGEVNYYVHDRLGVPLVVTDDDISGTFTFLRAMPDHGNSPDLTPNQIGQTWLNYLIEGKTVLWWGGMGNSTEHTAYLRLKAGIPAPTSGSTALNGPIVAEQIGAQIFIDGWAMICPGDPERAAEFARRAASVSHDDEAIYGAQVLAAMEAQAFIEKDINRLLDTGVSVIPPDSTIARMIGDLREWHAKDGDWHTTFHRIQEHYGYHKYIGGCHMVPNHALIILGLLYGEGDFQKSLMICNTAGWDTDCNSGNLGCLLGIRGGLQSLGSSETVDWRGPVADRLLLPTADGGRCISDAVNETYQIVNIARALNGEAPVKPKDGARFHFELPGSVQGFRASAQTGQVTIENVSGHSQKGQRSLGIFCSEAARARVLTATFIQPDGLSMKGYELVGSPSLYSGQVMRAGIAADVSNARPVNARLVVEYYDANDRPQQTSGPETNIPPGDFRELHWTVPQLEGLPIYAAGLEISGEGKQYLDYLTWEGMAHTVFQKPETSTCPPPGPYLWRTAWVNAVDDWVKWQRESFRIIQNKGRGMIITGTREWKDYRVSARVRPTLLKSGGIAARVQGLRRFYALQFVEGGMVQLIKVNENQAAVLAEAPFDWQMWQEYELTIEVQDHRLKGWVEGKPFFDLEDLESPFQEGAVGFVLEEGQLISDRMTVEPV
jgi:ADP-ribosylglycohydrolase